MPLPDFTTLEPVSGVPDFESLEPIDRPDSFKDTTNLTGPLLTPTRQPLLSPMPTTVGGGRAPVASAAETLLEPMEEFNQPRIQLPKATPKEGEPFLTTIGKEAYNIASGNEPWSDCGHNQNPKSPNPAIGS